MKFTITPVEGGICAVEGVFAGAVNAGFKKEGFDLGFIRSIEVMDVAYLFTSNRFKAAPLKYVINNNITKTNFILANSKNANAMTGEKGIEDIKEILDYLKEKTSALNPIMSSTGVIGVRLDREKIKKGIDRLDFNAKKGGDFARAIMTTDSFPKEIALEVSGDFGGFKIGAAAKGAGMINPQMATMLCFIVTDADIAQNEMKDILKELNETTFNAISVDGDTSTNDSVFLMTTRKAGYDRGAFKEALKRVMLKLATDIVRDGEGANKLVAFRVKGAADEKEAKKAAKSLSNSLLMKTALFGEDPNWGRIASTVGSSGVECGEDSMRIKIGNVLVYDRGEILFDEEREKQAHEVMKQDSFKIEVDLGVGEGEFTAYGCDLSYEYVKINAEYRT